MPRVTTYSDLRSRLKSHCDRVAETREPPIIRRRGGADVALGSLEESSGLKETARLLRSPENARRLLESIEEVRSGNGVVLTVAELRSKFGLDE